jgi:hypothetical protein
MNFSCADDSNCLCTTTAIVPSLDIRELAHENQIIALSVFISPAPASGFANAKRYVKGWAVGGVAGHVAGKHGRRSPQSA